MFLSKLVTILRIIDLTSNPVKYNSNNNDNGDDDKDENNTDKNNSSQVISY